MSTYRYLTENNEVKPARDILRIKSLIQSGYINNDTLVSENGEDWVTCGELLEKKRNPISKIATAEIKMPKLSKSTGDRAKKTAIMIDVFSYLFLLAGLPFLFVSVKSGEGAVLGVFFGCVLCFVMSRAKADELRLMLEIRDKNKEN